ncbi:probable LRR receptor-like serine/threonine-protein kinase isoform X1, partial [Tanacetum coccineum]
MDNRMCNIITLYNSEEADNLSGESLRFQIKLRVALDSAKGILYVHTKAKPPVFHGDIKTRNILTDSELTAKVADFELLRPAPILGDYGVGPNYVSTDVRGTPIRHKLARRGGKMGRL